MKTPASITTHRTGIGESSDLIALARDGLHRLGLNNPALMIMTANWAAYAANALTLVITARVLGAHGRGAYSSVLIWAMTSASVADLSLGPALARAVTVGYRLQRLRRFLPRAYTVAALVAGVVMFGLVNTVLVRGVPDLDGTLIAISVAPALILNAWGGYFFQGLGDQRRYALVRMLPPVIGMLLILVQAAAYGIGLDSALLAFSLSYWAVGVWSAVSAWRYLSTRVDDPATLHPSPARAGGPAGGTSMSLLSYGIRAHFGSLASIASSRLDLLLLTIIVPLAAVGNYALAVSLTTPVAMVGLGLGVANFRRIGTATSNDLSLIKSVWRRYFLPTVALACLPAGAALLIPHVLGHEFQPAVGPTLLLSAGTVGLGAMYIGTDVLQARGLPGISSMLSIAAAVSSAVTLLILVPRFGIDGAAISSAFTYLVIGACCVPITLRRWSRTDRPAVAVNAFDYVQ